MFIITVELNNAEKLDIISLKDYRPLGASAFKVRLNIRNSSACGEINFGARQTDARNPTDNPNGFVSSDFNGDSILDATASLPTTLPV